MLYAFFGNYLIPMITMIFFYVHIVKAVVMHEAALKAQAKKMNVESLRSDNAVRRHLSRDHTHKYARNSQGCWQPRFFFQQAAEQPPCVVRMLYSFGPHFFG